jgi:hypothetical protein
MDFQDILTVSKPFLQKKVQIRCKLLSVMPAFSLFIVVFQILSDIAVADKQYFWKKNFPFYFSVKCRVFGAFLTNAITLTIFDRRLNNLKQ